MIAPLAFSACSSAPFELRVAVLLGGEHRLGGSVDEVADLDLAGQDRGADDVAHEAHLRLPDRVGQLADVEGVARGQVAQQHHDRQAEDADGTEHGVAHQGASADAGLVEAVVERLDRGVAILLRGGGGVAHLDHLGVRHQLAGEVDDADADEQQGDTEGDAQRHRRGAESGDGVPAVADLEAEVGDDEEEPADHGGDEHRRDLALRALLGLGVDVRRTPRVRREAGVGERLGLAVRRHVRLVRHGGAVRCVDLVVVVVAHAFTLLFLLRVVCEAIQTAAPTSEPMPTSQPNRPSETGPRAPSVKPAYSGVSWMLSR